MAFSLAAFSSCRRSTRGSPLIRSHLDCNQTKGGQEGHLTYSYIVLNLLSSTLERSGDFEFLPKPLTTCIWDLNLLVTTQDSNPLLKSDCKIKSFALQLSFPTAVQYKACNDGEGYPWQAENYNSRDSKIPKLIHLEMIAFHLDLEINPHLHPDCITHSCFFLFLFANPRALFSPCIQSLQ